MTSTETGSAALLKRLARPVVADCPNAPLQKAMIAELEGAIKKNGAKFDKNVLFVGAFELTAIPPTFPARSTSSIRFLSRNTKR
jgi:hypothetical protein